MANILCQSCGHENDPTRTFCQNCGIRLEVPVATIHEQAAPQSPTPQPEKESIQKSRNPSANTNTQGGAKEISIFGSIIVGVFRLVATFIEVGLLAAFSAALIQAWRVPPDMPVAETMTHVEAQQFITTVRTAEETPYPREVEITQEQVNKYLTESIKLETAEGMLSDYIKFKRVFVIFGNQEIDTVIDERGLSHPFYISIRYKIVKRNNGQNAIPIAAYIGHLPLHPLIISYLEHILDPIYSAISGELTLLQGASGITITPDKAVIHFTGAHKK
ncbi:MAG: zinc ribbon domain-containing protein [Chthoniobacterales bacterium]